MARSQMVCWKHDNDGRSNMNPIRDTCLYEVEFTEVEMTELTANIIAESMYAQCNVDRKKYLLLEAFIDHRKNGSALRVEEQKIFVKGKKPLESQQLVRTFVANGNLEPNHGRSYQTLWNCTQSRLPNMPQHRAFNMNQPLTGGLIIS